MKSLKNERGAITIMVLASVLLFTTFLISTYMIVSNKIKSQKEIIDETKKIYQTETAEEAYSSFFAGYNVPILPEGYTQVEYIESTGTQYIDVGFKPNQDTSMEVNFLLTDFSNYPPISNSRNTATTGYFGMSVLDSDTFRFLYYNSLNDLDVSTLNTFNTYLLDKNKMYINGEAKGEFTYRNFQVIHNLYIFADNINGSIARYSKMKLKSYRLKDNGEIIRNLIPCIRNRDSEPGLYDIVTNEFYTNQGSGKFLYGAQVE